MKKSLLALIAASMCLVGCGSTDNEIDPELISNTPPPKMPESYQTMVDFRIISKSDANKVVNGQRQTVQNKMGEFRTSAAGQLTDDGKMFVGFGLAQLFGGGVSLGNFFNPYALLRSTAHENHLKKSFFWVKVDDDCDEECGYQKIYDVLTLAAQYSADNFMRMRAKYLDGVEYEPAEIAPLKVVDAKFSKINILMQKLSKSYMTDIINLDRKWDFLEIDRPFFSVYDADFITVNGKRYFGSRVTTGELFTARFHRLGQHKNWPFDNSLTLGLAKATETYPGTIFIETQNFVQQRSVEDPDKFINPCQGDLMVTQGKVTFMHLFPHCAPVNIDKSNLINAQVHDARTEIFTDEEWQSMMSQEGEETASTKL